MSMKNDAKAFAKKVKFNMSNIFKRKIPIEIPVYHGELLKNRVALITGGSSGIGFSIAKSFLQNGATVVIAGRNEEKLSKSIADLKQINENIYAIRLDVNETETFDNKIFEIEKLLNGKKIDILVNSAGIISTSKIGTTSNDEYDTVLNTNLKGTYFLSQSIAKYMKDNKIKGNILNIASSSSLRPATNPYAVSKWGIKGLTIGMAKKYIDYGIVVNGIAPGPTATSMLNEDNTSKANNISKSQYPLDRYITPEEIANLAVFLTSDMGKMIIGDIVYMTGGIGTTTVDDLNY